MFKRFLYSNCLPSFSLIFCLPLFHTIRPGYVTSYKKIKLQTMLVQSSEQIIKYEQIQFRERRRIGEHLSRTQLQYDDAGLTEYSVLFPVSLKLKWLLFCSFFLELKARYGVSDFALFHITTFAEGSVFLTHFLCTENVSKTGGCWRMFSYRVPRNLGIIWAYLWCFHRVVTGEKNSPIVAHACRKRRLKWVIPQVGDWSTGLATLSL
jgi:hypothetical protein